MRSSGVIFLNFAETNEAVALVADSFVFICESGTLPFSYFSEASSFFIMSQF